ncbi:MAG: DUF58 domain-containing protein [Elusimicrobiota bacterium]
MIAKELLAQVRRIEILTGRLVTESLAGEYHSVFKGRGMEFAEVREYSAGDDIRTIDWNVTARTGRPYVRLYTEERELTVSIACDLSGSQSFGSAQRLKKEVAAELSAVLAFSALQNNDKVGLFVFTEGVEEHIPPKKGRRHALHIIREILAFSPAKRGTRIGASLDTIVSVLKRRCILFVISDFRDSGFEKALRLAALKHDVVPVVVCDPREARLPGFRAYLDLEDPETGERTLVNASASGLLAEQERAEDERLARLTALFGQCGLESIRVSTDKPYIDALVQFFHRRARRLHH